MNLFARAPFRAVKSPLKHAVLAALASMQCAALANPVGEKVIAGSAAIQSSGNTLTVRQGTDRAIINWQGFSIGAGELTKFIQPSAASAVLNRVISGSPSALLGRLEANGKVFLINPNGILVGGGAVINTNSFVASTRDVSNAQFMAGGDLNFVGASTAGITNLGTIKAEHGDVFLIAHSVENAGTIEAGKGVAGLAAGNDVLLKPAGDERLLVRSTVPAQTGVGIGVDNSGVIAAVRAELKVARGNVYALAVNNSGSIHATGIADKDGRILLVSEGGNVENAGRLVARNANGDGGAIRIAAGPGAIATSSGVIDASGKAQDAHGGAVTITGERVALTGSAMVDVSGDAGGGTALIGGGFQGRDAQVENAERTLVGRNARIAADAISSGDGGTVIVWADKDTTFKGHISARGGTQGGDGGFAEVSGKDSLAFNGAVDLGARVGKRGTLLLDPKNLRVETGGPAAVSDVDQFSDNPAANTSIDPATLAAANANIQLQANNDITFASPLTLNVARSLTASAGRSIIVDASITTSSAPISLTANEAVANGVVDANRDAGNASIVMAPAAVISSGGGDVTLTVGSGSGLTFSQSGDIAVSRINAGGGTVSLLNQGPSNGAIRQQGGPVQAAKLVVDARGAITLEDVNNNVGTLNVSNGGALAYVNATGLTVGEAGAGAPQLNLGAIDATIRTLTGDLTLAADATTAVGATGTLTLDAGGNLFVNGSIGGVSSRDTSLVFKGGQNVTVSSQNLLARNLAATATAGSVAFARGTSQLVAINDGAPNGTVTLTGAQGVTTGATTDLSGRSLAVSVAGGDGVFGGVTTFNTLTANVSGNLTMEQAQNGFDELGAITAGGNVSIKDTVDQNGLRIVGNLESTGGNVTIGTSGNALFRPGGRVVVGSSATIDFRTLTGQILDDAVGTPSFTGGALALAAGSIGGGESNPLNTQVSRLEANAGFMYVQNTGPLAIGGVANDLNGLVFTGRDSTGVGVFLRNDQTISVVTPGDNIAGFGPGFGSIALAATRADADIVSSEVIVGVGVTLDAGRDISLGDVAATREARVGGAGVNLIAGRSILISGPTQIVSGSADPIIAIAGQSIIVRPPVTVTENTAPQFSSQGNVNLVAQNGAIDLNNGAASRPVIIVNQGGGTAKIDLAANEMNIGSRLDAGAGPVFLRQATPSQPVSVGFESAGTLSISDAELDRIAAGTVTIGAATHPGNITVDGGISRPSSGTTYSALALLTDGALFVNGDVDLGTASLALNSRNTINAFANITASSISASSAAGSALLNGRLRVGSLAVSAPGGNVSANNDNNEIGSLGAILYNGNFNLKDSAGGLTTTAFVDGGASSSATIEVRGGQLVLNPGTKIFFSGAGNDLRLFSDTGFTNNVDGSVLVPENGARWLIYSPSAAVTTLNGLTPDFPPLTGVSFPDRPFNPGNGVLFAMAGGTAPGGGGTGGGGTGGGGTGSGGTSGGTSSGSVTAPAGSTGTAGSGLDETSDMQEFAFTPRAPRFEAAPTMASAAAVLRTLANVDLDRVAADSPDFNAFVNAMSAVNNAFVDYRLRLTTLIDKDKSVMIGEQVAFLKRMVNNVDEAMTKVSRAFTRFFVGELTPNALRAIALNSLTDPLALMEEVDRLEGMNQGQWDRAARLQAEAEERARVAAIAAAEAKRQADIAEAKRVRAVAAARKTIVTTDGRLIFVPSGDELQYDANGFPLYNFSADAATGLGQRLGPTEISRIVSGGGGNISFADVSKIVSAGGGNLTPGVLAAIISAGAGNLTQNQVNAIVSGGGGNLTRAGQFAVISAGIVSNDGATLLGKDLAGIVSGGAGNIVSNDGATLLGQDGAGIVSGGAGNIVSNDGATLLGQDGAGIISGGAGNFTGSFSTQMASFITGGAITPDNVAAIVSGGGGNIVSGGGGNIVSGGGGNLIAAGIVAGAVKPGSIASIVSGGAGNFTDLAAMAGIVSGGGGNIVSGGGGNIVSGGGGNIVSGGGGNIVSGGGGNIVSGGGGNIVSGGGGNIVSGGGGNIVSGGGGNIAGSIAGSNQVNLGR